MNITILTQYYPPEVGAPQARLSALARALARCGHCVTVLTAMPNYPTGKIQKGYGGLLMTEEQDGVRVIRTFVYATQKTKVLPRLGSYASFVVSSAVFGSVCLGPCDYVLVESPPLFLGLSGFLLSRLKGARLIFNVSDLWPESALRLGVVGAGSVAHRLGSWLESWCYRHAWLITGQSREIIESIRTRFPGCRTFHLSNGVDCSTFRPDRAAAGARRMLGTERGPLAVYAGLHGLAQGLEVLIEAAEFLPAECDLRIILIGDGPEKQKLVARAGNRCSRRIRFLDPRSHAEMPDLLAAADLVVVPLRSYIPGAVPSKLYEAMASGRPVVLMAQGEAARTVRESGAGVVVVPGDVGGLASALQTLAADAGLRWRLGAAGRVAAERQFDRARIAERFIEYLERQQVDRCHPVGGFLENR